jgi:hypothetical protein
MSPLHACGAPRSPPYHPKATPPGRERRQNAAVAQSQRFRVFTQEGEAGNGFGPCSRLQRGEIACNALNAICATAGQKFPLAQSPSQRNCFLDLTKLDPKAAELHPLLGPPSSDMVGATRPTLAATPTTISRNTSGRERCHHLVKPPPQMPKISATGAKQRNNRRTILGGSAWVSWRQRGIGREGEGLVAARVRRLPSRPKAERRERPCETFFLASFHIMHQLMQRLGLLHFEKKNAS